MQDIGEKGGVGVFQETRNGPGYGPDRITNSGSLFLRWSNKC